MLYFNYISIFKIKKHVIIIYREQKGFVKSLSTSYTQKKLFTFFVHLFLCVFKEDDKNLSDKFLQELDKLYEADQLSLGTQILRCPLRFNLTAILGRFIN